MTKKSRNRERGKDAERAVAKTLGGTRIGTMGKEDVMLPDLSVEVKSRKKFVAKGWMDQALKNCPDGKTPIVVVHISNTPYKNDMVLMRVEDFTRLYTHTGLKE